MMTRSFGSRSVVWSAGGVCTLRRSPTLACGFATAIDGRVSELNLSIDGRVAELNSSIEVLGTVVGNDADVLSQFADRTAKTGDIHLAIEEVCDAATELTLGRSCAERCACSQSNL